MELESLSWRSKSREVIFPFPASLMTKLDTASCMPVSVTLLPMLQKLYFFLGLAAKSPSFFSGLVVLLGMLEGSFQ